MGPTSVEVEGVLLLNTDIGPSRLIRPLFFSLSTQVSIDRLSSKIIIKLESSRRRFIHFTHDRISPSRYENWWSSTRIVTTTPPTHSDVGRENPSPFSPEGTPTRVSSYYSSPTTTHESNYECNRVTSRY